MKEKKTVRMRKYQRRRARAVMEREGVRGMNRRQRDKSGNRKYVSYFALNWKDAAKITLRKKRA